MDNKTIEEEGEATTTASIDTTPGVTKELQRRKQMQAKAIKLPKIIDPLAK